LTRFAEQIVNLVGKSIRLGRGGPDEQKGTLITVKDDYLTLYSNNGLLIHYPLYHLKSITEMTSVAENQQNDQEEKRKENPPSVSAVIYELLRGQVPMPDATASPLSEATSALPNTFLDLMRLYAGKKIQVYDHGPESASGFVFDVGEDYVKLVTGPDELVHYPFFHIRSCRMATAKQNDKNQNDKNQNDKNQESGDKEKNKDREKGRNR
jgi:spore coat protein B